MVFVLKSFGTVRSHWMSRVIAAGLLISICTGLQASVPNQSIQKAPVDVVTVAGPTALDRGFSDLYNLDFDGAQREFSSWQGLHPNDPVGPVSEAAGYLFSEFNRLGVLEAQFFTDNKFMAGKKLSPDPALRSRFDQAIERGEKLAQARLAANQKDSDGLFSLTLANGLRADYAQLIEKRNLAALHYTRQASDWAQQLLAVDPHRYDALLATGFTKYVIGSMSAPMRWILRVGGLGGDKAAGIAELKTVSTQGHYLAPFARMLLAIAYVRENDKTSAIDMLSGLRRQFPANALFDREIRRLQTYP